jgi:hypothetical protein
MGTEAILISKHSFISAPINFCCYLSRNTLIWRGLKKKKLKMLTVREVSGIIGAPLVSVRLWAREGKFPGARLERSPVGPYWLIPDTTLKGFERKERGRPNKPKTVTANHKKE